MGHNWKSDENKAARRGEYESCEVCGGRFYVPPSQKGKRRRCSKECKATTERKDVECTCKNCSETFLAKARDVRRGRGQFCCLACSGEYKSKQAKANPKKKMRTLEDWDKYRREVSSLVRRGAAASKRRKKRAG